MKVSNLSDQEHIQAYKHNLRSLYLTKVLANNYFLIVNHLLDTIHEFIKGEISVHNKREQQDTVPMEGKGKKLYCSQDHAQQLLWEQLPYPYNWDLCQSWSRGDSK